LQAFVVWDLIIFDLQHSENSLIKIKSHRSIFWVFTGKGFT